MADERKDALWLLPLLLLAVGSAVLSLKVLGRRAPSAAPRPEAAAPERRPSVFEGRRAQDEAGAGLRRRELGVERGSSLEMVSRYGPPPAEAPAPAANGRVKKESSKDEGGLSPRERDLLVEAAGRWDEGRAAELGGTRGLMFKVGGRLLRHPKVLRWVLDQPVVAAGVMRQERVRRVCSDLGAFERYLTDKRDMGGVSLALTQLKNSLNYPGATEAGLGSKTMSDLILGCGSLKALTGDPARVGRIAVANPEFLPLLSDPRLMDALTRTPLAMGVFQGIQAGVPTSLTNRRR